MLEAIDIVKSQHQRPTFDRILVSYKKLNKDAKATPILILRSHIESAIRKGLIRAVESSNGVATSYLPTNTYKNHSPSGSSKYGRSSESRVLSCESQTSGTSSISLENSKSFDNMFHVNSKINEIPTNDYIDFSDIDIEEDREEDSESELSPQMFPSLANNSTSFSLNSVPIPSYNHSRNREVIRRHTTVPSSCNPEDIQQLLSKSDHQNWLLEELPRYTPFIGQKGDRVVYLRDAHRIYIDYELQELLKLYKESNCDCEQIDKAIGDKYIVKAIVTKVKFYQNNYIRFSIIELKNTPEDTDAFCFNVLYRPNRGICDFLVLEKFFNQSQTCVWKSGSEFRSLWKKSWWTGRVIGKSVFNEQYPDSPFKCYKIKWHTDEEGRLSPWDLFEIEPTRLPKRKENGVLVQRADLLHINYKPDLNEWPEVDNLDFQKWRYFELKRVYSGIKFIEKYVDKSVLKLLDVPPNKEISYPIDLRLIKKRLKNLFYRRKDAVITEIENLKANAKLYIKPKYLKFGEDVVSLLLAIANDNEVINHEHLKMLLDSYPHLIQGIQDKSSTQSSSGSQKRSSSLVQNSTKKKFKGNRSDQTQSPNTSQTSQTVSYYYNLHNFN